VAGGLFPAIALDPNPWLHYLPTCPSTNTWAIANLAQLNHGDVIFTKQQTSGRGQHGRAWYSGDGVFTASFVLANMLPEQLLGLSLVVGVVMVEVLIHLIPDLTAALQLKWANDLILDGKKLGGSLCEARQAQTLLPTFQVVIGIGLNLTAQIDPQVLPHAISICQYTDQAIATELELLSWIRRSLLNLPNLATKITSFRNYDFLLGKQIQIKIGNEILCGQACGISDRGELQLALASGEVKSLRSGHILS